MDALMMQELTDAPTKELTDAPTKEPTDAPTKEPTDAPHQAANRWTDQATYGRTY